MGGNRFLLDCETSYRVLCKDSLVFRICLGHSFRLRICKESECVFVVVLGGCLDKGFLGIGCICLSGILSSFFRGMPVL